MPLAVPLPLSGRAIGAVGMWFPDGPPDLDDDRAPRSSPSRASARRRSTGRGCTRPSTRSPTSCSAACSRPACRRWPGSPVRPGTHRPRSTRCPAVTGTTCCRSARRRSRSSSATSSGTGRPPRPSWGSCAACWRRSCSTAARPPPRSSGSTGSPPASPERPAAPAHACSTTGRPVCCAGHWPGIRRCCWSAAPAAHASWAAPTPAGRVPCSACAADRPTPRAARRSRPGSSIVLYTDGLVERRGELLDTGLERLATAAAACRAWVPPSSWRRWRRPRSATPGPADDVALLVVRAVPAPLEGRLPARGESMRVLRRSMADWEAAAGLPAELAEDLELALGEAARERGRARLRRAARGASSRTRWPGAPTATSRCRSATTAAGGRCRRTTVIVATGCGSSAQIAEDLRIDRGADGTHVRSGCRYPGAGVTAPLGPGADHRPGRGGAGVGAVRRRQARRAPATSTSPAATPSAPSLLGAAAGAGPLRRRPDGGALPRAAPGSHCSRRRRRSRGRRCRSSWRRDRRRRGCAR